VGEDQFGGGDFGAVAGKNGSLALPCAFDHGDRETLEGNEIGSPRGMDIGEAEAGERLIGSEARRSRPAPLT